MCGVSVTAACQTLPLADFGSTGFSAARATSTSGHTGSIRDRKWTTTKISLTEDGRRFIGIGGPPGQAAAAVTAVPSALAAAGSAFTVTYEGTTTGVTAAESTRVSAGRLVQGAAFSPTS